MESQFWKGLDKKFKTLFCVGLAGLFFISAVFFDLRFLFVLGSIFDWFPLIVGWMREKKGVLKKKKIYLHKAITLVAYLFGILWFVYHNYFCGFLFLEFWWLGVISGVWVSYEKK